MFDMVAGQLENDPAGLFYFIQGNIKIIDTLEKRIYNKNILYYQGGKIIEENNTNYNNNS